MKVSVNQPQPSTQGIQDQKKIDSGKQEMDFQGLMFQMMSMVNMPIEEQHSLENGMTAQVNPEISAQEPGIEAMNLENLEKQMSTLMEQISHSGLQEEHKNVAQQVSNLFRNLSQNPIEGEEVQEILQPFINMDDNNNLTISSEKLDSGVLQRLLTELEAIGKPIQQEDKLNKGKEKQSISKEEHPLDIKLNNRPISLSNQQKTESSQQDTKENATKEIMMEVKPNKEEKSVIENADAERTESKEISSIQQGTLFSKTLEDIQKPQGQVEIKNIQDITEQMVEEVRELKEGDKSILQVKLKPKELGEIEIKLEMKAGEVIGKILVESLSVKGALDTQLQYLKEQLKNQNIVIQEVEVTLQQHNQEENQERKHGFFSNEDSSSTKTPGQTYGEEEVEGQRQTKQPLMNTYYNRGRSSSLNLLA